MSSPKSKKNTSSNTRKKDSDQFIAKISNLPLEQIEKVKKVESLLLLLNLINIVLLLVIFSFLTTRGLVRLNAIVRINKTLWRESLNIAYYLSWIQIGVLIFHVLGRKRLKNLMKIPVTKRTTLKKEQVFGEQKVIAPTIIEGKTSNEEKELTKHLEKEKKDHSWEQTKNGEKKAIRENREIQKTENKSVLQLEKQSKYVLSYLRSGKITTILSIVAIAFVIGYLNYFPRGFGLFPSLEEYPDTAPNYAFILKPAEFFTFYIINIIWAVAIGMLFLFLISISLRKVKDMNKILQGLSNEQKEKEMKEKNKQREEWEPELKKPWSLMTLKEKREYKIQALENKKEYIKKKQKEEIRELFQEEKQKIKLGKKRYNKKKKLEEERKKKIEKKKRKTKEMKKEKLTPKTDKYDFR